MTSVKSSQLSVPLNSGNNSNRSLPLTISQQSSIEPVENRSLQLPVAEIPEEEEQEEKYENEEEEFEAEEYEFEEEEEFTDTEAEEAKPPSVSPSQAISQSPSKVEEAEEEKKNIPIFLCHEVEGNKQQHQQFRSATQMSSTVRTQRGDFGQMDDEYSEEDEYSKSPKKGKKYQRLYLDELEYRPAAMAPFPAVIRQITDETHNELHKLGCQRQVADKHKVKQEVAIGGKHGEDDTKSPREGMDKKMNRLKIYQRTLGSLVIYFRAYSPILVNIKKSYDDMLTFRLRQFKEAQHEKVRIHQDRVVMHAKMLNYQYPDHKKLLKARFYLTLLLTRISKQDDAIKCITEILSKMERCLSDHYEQERDLEDQIKLLELEITDRRERSMFPMKRFEQEDSQDNKEVTTEVKNTENGVVSDSEEEPIDENEEMNEDKRMVLILAYAVCLKDLEEAEKKLRVYENKYQNVSPRHELEIMKKNIIEDKDQVKLLLDERGALEQELLDLKEKHDSVDEELENLREMPEELRLDVIKNKFAKDKGLGGATRLENLDESLDDLDEDENDQDPQMEESIIFKV